MRWRPWFLENLEKNGVGFASNGSSRWEWRRHRFHLALVLAYLLVSIGIQLVVFTQLSAIAVFASGMNTPHVWLGIVFFVGPYAVVSCLMFYGVTYTLRAKKAAERADGYACPNCLHDLSAAAVNACPECGQRIIYEALPVLWTRRVKRRGAASRDPRFAKTGFDDRGHSRHEAVFRERMILVMPLIFLGLFGPSLVIDYLGKYTAVTVDWYEQSLWGLFIPLMLLAVLVGPALLWMMQTTRRMRNALERSGGLCCPACLADLSAEPVDACTECGQPVVYDRLRRSWTVKMKTLEIELDAGGAGG